MVFRPMTEDKSFLWAFCGNCCGPWDDGYSAERFASAEEALAAGRERARELVADGLMKPDMREERLRVVVFELVPATGLELCDRQAVRSRVRNIFEAMEDSTEYDGSFIHLSEDGLFAGPGDRHAAMREVVEAMAKALEGRAKRRLWLRAVSNEPAWTPVEKSPADRHARFLAQHGAEIEDAERLGEENERRWGVMNASVVRALDDLLRQRQGWFPVAQGELLLRRGLVSINGASFDGLEWYLEQTLPQRRISRVLLNQPFQASDFEEAPAE